SWAVFAQGNYDITDALRLTAGARYTEDVKHFHVISAPLYIVPPAPVRTDDDKVSWDVSLRYQFMPDISFYTRVATGFRAPSIQGRDVAFGSAAAPSVARSETILSWEAGVKTEFWDHHARVNADVFDYTLKHQQFSAIGGAANLTQLVNANKGRAWGAELDADFRFAPNLFVTVGYAYTHTEIDDPNLTVAPCGSGQCTVLDPRNGLGNAFVNGNPFPQ